MPPALTETWGAAYIQIIVVLLIFVLGIPAILNRLELPEYLRRIRSRPLITATSMLFVFAIIYIVFALAFIWFIHPFYDPIYESLTDWFGALMITGALLLILVGWFLLNPMRNRRKEIIRSRRDDFARLKKPYSKQKAIVDLISIGEQSEPGLEKGLVIDALDEIIKRIQEDSTYSGVSVKGQDLDLAIRGIETITVGDGQHCGNYNNFQQAGEVLSDALFRLRATPSVPDAALIIGALRRLAINALKLEAEDETASIVTIVLQNIADFAALPDADYSTATRAIFLVGFTVLAQEEEKKYLFSTIALSRLLALANGKRHSAINIEEGIFLLGLLAHFWARDKSRRKFARRVLSEEVETLFEGGIRNVLKRAAEIHEEQSRFDTADALIAMAEGL